MQAARGRAAGAWAARRGRGRAPGQGPRAGAEAVHRGGQGRVGGAGPNRRGAEGRVAGGAGAAPLGRAGARRRGSRGAPRG
jgi:hypothetical protein